MRRVPTFLLQLRQLLNDQQYDPHPSIRWATMGTEFEILNIPRFELLLPKYFKMTKYSSFRRQLNNFSFKKAKTSTSTQPTYGNPHFLMDQPAKMAKIQRAKEKRRSPRRRQSFPNLGKVLVHQSPLDYPANFETASLPELSSLDDEYVEEIVGLLLTV